MEIHGTCASGLAGLRDAFAANFERHGELGAAVAVVMDGELVADLGGGHADAAQTRPWQAETLVNVWTTSKGVAAT